MHNLISIRKEPSVHVFIWLLNNREREKEERDEWNMLKISAQALHEKFGHYFPVAVPHCTRFGSHKTLHLEKLKTKL